MSQAQQFMPDIDNAKEFGNPTLPEGTFELNVLGMGIGPSSNPTLPPTNIFTCDFEVVEIVTQAPPRAAGEKDTNPPQPTQIGEVRAWKPAIGLPGMSQIQMANFSKSHARMRDLIQAALRFSPGSPLAATALGPDGKPLSWNAVLGEAVKESNPLAGAKVRCTVSRVITQRGKGFAMYVPSFSVSSRVEARTTAKVDSF